MPVLRSWFRTGLFGVGVGVLLPSSALAVPPSIAVQGVLRDNQGMLQSLPLSVTVSFYDAAVAGKLLAGPFGPLSAQADNGYFSLLVGDATLGPALAAATDVWMEVSEGPDVFPREHVVSEPFALVAGSFAGSLAGDVSGTQQKTVVSAIRGTAVAATAPADTNVLGYDGTAKQWAPQAAAAAGTAYLQGMNNQTVFGGVNGTLAHATFTAPGNGQVVIQSVFQVTVDNIINGVPSNCNVQWAIDPVANRVTNTIGYGANLYPSSMSTRNNQGTSYLGTQTPATAQFAVQAGRAYTYYLNGTTSCAAASWANIQMTVMYFPAPLAVTVTVN